MRLGVRRAMMRSASVAASGEATEFDFANLGTDASTADASVYTFSSKNLGVADASRYILVGVALRAVGTPIFSSVTVGGETATAVGSAAINDNSSRTILQWFIADLTASALTLGDIVVTMSAACVRCYVAWHRMVVVNPTAHEALNDIAEAGGGVLAVALDIPAGGVACAISCYGASGADETTAWSLATEHDDRRIESSNCSHASEEFATTQTNLTVQATCAGADSNIGAMATCSFGPA